MTTHLVTFADSSMSRSAELCMASGMAHGVDQVHVPWSPSRVIEAGLDPELLEGRGCGFWRFKPFIIGRAMQMCLEGDTLAYSDAGIEFINNVNYIIDRMDQDIFLFGNMYEHAHWCKRDIVEAIFPSENPPYMSRKNWDEFGKQVQASVIFFRVSDHTRAFVKEWLDWCLFEGGRLIDDSRSRVPNHPQFQENRHDQAILTTMGYRDGIKLHWWPSVYNDGAFTYPRGEYQDDYPTLFHHHRGVKTGERAA